MPFVLKIGLPTPIDRAGQERYEGISDVFERIRFNRYVQVKRFDNRGGFVSGQVAPLRREDAERLGLSQIVSYPVVLVQRNNLKTGENEPLQPAYTVIPWDDVEWVFQPRFPMVDNLFEHFTR